MKDKYNCEFSEINNISSAMECTGLMYKPPVDMDEYESYHELLDMEFPDIDDRSHQERQYK